MLQSPGPAHSVRTYLRRCKSDGEPVEELCSSSSSVGSYEKRALISPAAGSRSEPINRRQCKLSSSMMRDHQRRDKSNGYIYETSWESHRQRGGSETSRKARYSKERDKDRYSRLVNVMSKDTKYLEVNERGLNKLSDTKSSTETGRTDDAWNITGTEDKQVKYYFTAKNYFQQQKTNAIKIILNNFWY